MKKIIVILILCLLSISCNKYIVTNVYERTYYDKQNVINDIYYRLHSYAVDSIPLDQWITNIMETDTINIQQKMIKKTINKKSSYHFIFIAYTYPSSIFYNFIIRFYGNEKDFKK